MRGNLGRGVGPAWHPLAGARSRWWSRRCRQGGEALPLPSEPPRAPTWPSVAGAGRRDAGVREGHACKGACSGVRVRKRMGRKGRERHLCRWWAAVPCRTVFCPSACRAWAALAPILTVLLRYITVRNVLCAHLSKDDSQPYNICFFFPSSFQRFCERFSQLDVFLINKSRGSYFFSFVHKVGTLSYRQLETA